MTNKNYFSDYLQDKTAAAGSSSKYTPASRMSILRGKIDRYRDKQKEDAKKKEKDGAARLKEIQKQQEQMQQPQSVADKMRENFNQFAGTNFAGSNPTALPTVSAPTPIGTQQQQKQAAFYKKVACLVKEIDALYKYAEDGKSATETIANDNSTADSIRKGVSDQTIKNDTSIPKSDGWMKFVSDWGPMLLQMSGMKRNDDRKNLDGRMINVHHTMNHQHGNIDSFLNGQRMVRGFTTPGNWSQWTVR